MEINPESAFASNNLGTVLRAKGRFDEATVFYYKALGLDPDFVGAYCNLGVVYQEKGLADWRWLIDRDYSPWYPTMRLFRQSSPGDWEPVIARIKTKLSRLSEESLMVQC